MGRTCSSFTRPSSSPDHPHACGENAVGTLHHASPIGPSPRVWGEPDSEGSQLPFFRTIPTRVGRTLCFYLSYSCPSDHPHACGENWRLSPLSGTQCGPSPRVWGEQNKGASSNGFARTIPTRVGRTILPIIGTWGIADHPHACGENVCGVEQRPSVNGPSPRVWGERLRR